MGEIRSTKGINSCFCSFSALAAPNKIRNLDSIMGWGGIEKCNCKIRNNDKTGDDSYVLMDLIIKCLRGPLHAQTPVLSYIKPFKAHCVKSDPI